MLDTGAVTRDATPPLTMCRALSAKPVCSGATRFDAKAAAFEATGAAFENVIISSSSSLLSARVACSATSPCRSSPSSVDSECELEPVLAMLCDEGERLGRLGLSSRPGVGARCTAPWPAAVSAEDGADAAELAVAGGRLPADNGATHWTGRGAAAA